MFSTFSMTGSGIVIFAVMAGLKYLNVNGVSEDQVAGAIANGVQLVSFVMMLWGQIRRSDLNLGLVRK